MSSNEKLVTLIDALDRSGSMLLGWSVPSTRMSEFLVAVDAAAIQAGGVPFEEIITDGITEQVTASNINRSVIDARNSLFDEAEQIINEGNNIQQ